MPVVVGTPEQIARLEALAGLPTDGNASVVVIGGGRVGCAATAELRAAGDRAHLIERDERAARRLRE